MNDYFTNTNTFDKADLLNRLLQADYEALIRIDTFGEFATTLYASDKIWARTNGVEFS